jgi:hypothetical protein
MKDGYHKLTLFKLWVTFFKIDERSRVISEIFSRKNLDPNMESIATWSNQHK